MKRALFFILVGIFCIGVSLAQTMSMTYAAPTGDIPTDANFKVAFIGDTEAGADFISVLSLIKNEGAQLVMHQGDMGYSANASQWGSVVNSSAVGPNFPYLMSDGNHDDWASYAPFVQDRLTKMGISTSASSGDYSVVYKGLKMVFLHEPGRNSSFINSSLQSDTHIWKVCSWHHNMNDFQAGGKGDESAWASYQACQNNGAIIATGHEHSYSRTYTLNGNQSSNTHAVEGTPQVMNIAKGSPGKSFVFVSGNGGNSLRVYIPGSHDDDKWWATIYTLDRYCKYTCTKSDFTGQDKSRDLSSPSAKHGATFITFNVDGNPYKARGYHKLIDGTIVDEFELYAEGSGTTGVPSPTGSTPSPTGVTPTVTGTPGQYDLNGDGGVNLLDLIELIDFIL